MTGELGANGTTTNPCSPDSKEIDIPFVEPFTALRSAEWRSSFVQEFEGVKLHAFSRLGLNLVGRCDVSAAEYMKAVLVFTDGGFTESSGSASWAFTVIGRDGSGDYWFLGSVAGPVITDPTSPLWVGAEKASNNTGEVSAALWAYAWLCSVQNPVPAILHLDSTVAGHLCDAT